MIKEVKSSPTFHSWGQARAHHPPCPTSSGDQSAAATLAMLFGIGTKLNVATFIDTTRLFLVSVRFAGLIHWFQTIGISIAPNVCGW
jgi:hypothetical protein